MDKFNQAIEQLQTLNRLAQTISSTLETEEILKTILRASIGLTNAEQGSILSFAANDDRPVHTLYKTAETVSGDQLSGLSDLIGGWVYKNKSQLIIENFSRDARFEKAKSWFPEVTSILAAPMLIRDVISGIIILTKTEPFQAEDAELMNIIASQCAQFVENAKRYALVLEENLQLRGEIQRQFDFNGVIGHSVKMQQVFDMLKRVFPGETRILIGGESGTGKELIARTIHYNGPRKDKNFVAIDCGALPENLLESELFGHVKGAFTGAIRDKKGLFEIAGGGTLFLDEVANTSLQFQARLLRAIQEGEIKPVGATGAKKVDVRIIAATSSDLQQKVTTGEFREDLYYRLNVLFINLPPLRERREDIRLLSEHFLKNFAAKTKKSCRLLTKETLGLLEHYT
jgi:transcriptional regulator with GAF, ATPase, and Fis domain